MVATHVFWLVGVNIPWLQFPSAGGGAAMVP